MLKELFILLLVGLVRGDADFDNFMSSLSYNWQNEFSDLRYQIDQLQKTDPAKYSALGASLGLKAGQQIQVPSQYSPQWASQFVMAAGLYTPPPPSAATFNPASATPTAVVATTTGPLTPTGISISGLMISTTATATITNDTHSSGGSHHSGDAEATAGLDTQNTSSQFGNPIAGNLNTDDTPIIPSGIGYNTGHGLTVPWAQRKNFGCEIAKISVDCAFKPYADAVRRLIYLEKDQ
ncbi:hypothetical protein IWW39_004734 [Coemansia spiralis]|uniref:Uncharacterized protein n=1 Tax=Coemansia spiralis TaxID=417178 RepID=A0A9W8L3D7_9FUNG|nr:hypothetical protein IWW39_004734 [Coemansia spiralis]